MFLLSPSAMGCGWCSKLHPSLPSFPPFFTLSKCWLSWVMLLSLTSLNADVYCSAPCWCKKLEVERDTQCHLSSGLTPTKQRVALVSSGLAGLQHRGGFGGLGVPHPKSFPGVCSCFGTQWQFGRLKFLPRVNFLFGKSCTFRLSLPGFFTP